MMPALLVNLIGCKLAYNPMRFTNNTGGLPTVLYWWLLAPRRGRDERSEFRPTAGEGMREANSGLPQGKGCAKRIPAIICRGSGG